ncbi:MAG: tetratricopeptide repeat protein [Acidobacteria bacterium]|nr:tetratricopeptide repeat protein [Acidobacteriota bacterium]
MKRLLLPVLVLCAACTSPAPPADSAAQAPAAATITTTSSSPEAVAQLRKGEQLLDNLRVAEASEAFAQALALDSNFVLAHAYHGYTVPGANGTTELEAAAAAAAGLPAAERALVEGIAAARTGDVAKASAAYARVTELAPGDWRGHFIRGQQLLESSKYAEAVESLKKATALNPEAGGAQNSLGYAALRQGDADGAVAAFEQYARILPTEPNAQDSLGEALLSAGRFADAEAAFGKALALSPGFWASHEGIAYAKFYAGDVAGARNALAEARAGAPRPSDKLGVDATLAAIAMAQHDTRGALAMLDTAEKASLADTTNVAFVPIRRALVLSDAGRHRDALVPVAAALATVSAKTLPPGPTRGLERQALVARAMAESGLRDVAALTKTSSALDALAAANPDIASVQSSMHFGRALLAVASGDAAGARQHFAGCSSEDDLCKWQALVAMQTAGDTAGVALAREQLLKQYLRDPMHLVIRSRLSSSSEAKAP